MVRGVSLRIQEAMSEGKRIVVREAEVDDTGGESRLATDGEQE